MSFCSGRQTGNKEERRRLMELNMALEEACGVSIPDEELANLKTVGDIFNYINAHV